MLAQINIVMLDITHAQLYSLHTDMWGYTPILFHYKTEFIMKKAVIISMLIVVSLATSIICGCNTMEGIGEDVQTLGRGISGVAD